VGEVDPKTVSQDEIGLMMTGGTAPSDTTAPANTPGPRITAGDSKSGPA